MDLNEPIKKDKNIEDVRDVIFSRLMDARRNSENLLDIVTYDAVKKAEKCLYAGKMLGEMNKNELMCCLMDACESASFRKNDIENKL